MRARHGGAAYLFFCFEDNKVSLCSFGWPYRDISASTSQMQRLNLYTTIPGSALAFNPRTQETDLFSPWTDWSIQSSRMPDLKQQQNPRILMSYVIDLLCQAHKKLRQHIPQGKNQVPSLISQSLSFLRSN